MGAGDGGGSSPEEARSLSEVVPAALGGQRADRVVAMLTGLPRSEVNGLIDGGAVAIDGRVAASRSRKLRAGQVVSVQLGPTRPEEALRADATVEVPVLYADGSVIVVDKPAGLVVHPGAGNATGTLVQGLLARFPDLEGLAAGNDAGGRERPGIVHRLDKGTSGLLVVARTPEARRSLTAQLAARQVRRVYLTLVVGIVAAEEGMIDAPLGRGTHDPTRMTVQVGGRDARTRYRVLTRYGTPAEATLLECRLETGRTHQIRVHLAAIGHPVVGDPRYGRSLGWLLGAPVEAPERLYLHAAALGFRHPDTGEEVSFRSPLPAELQRILDHFQPVTPLTGC